MTRFLFERQQLPDGSMPRNSLTNGKLAPDSFNTQLDECAYPLIMALAVGLTGHAYYKAHIAPAANFVASHGPSFGPERWEEQSGFSPSTISAEIAGPASPRRSSPTATATTTPRASGAASADEFQRNLKKWTLTTNGPLGHAAVLHPPLQDRRSRTRRSPTTSATAARRSTSARSSTPASSSTRGSACCRPTTPTSSRSLPVVDATIKRSTASGDGFLRYNGDGYGDGATDGHPWAPSQQGHRPPVAGAGRRARPVRARPRLGRRGASRAWTRCAT